jgi:NAD+-dependent farnesol dehydrogenase
MRVLVTGGTGYLGRAIVRTLAARGHEPVVFARRATHADLAGEAIDGDVRNRDALIAAARGCAAICHTAALVTVWRDDPREFDAINVGGLQNALVAARETRARILVYTSTFMALPPAGQTAPLTANDYQRTKVAAERIARQASDAGFPIVMLYPGVVYGPGVLSEGNLVGRLLADYVAGRLPGVIGADHVWSFAWVDDVAGAHVTALEHGTAGARYTLGGENAPQIRPFEIAGRVRGLKPPRRVPFWAADLAAEFAELGSRVTHRAPWLTAGTVDIFRHEWPLDHAAAARDLGYQVTPLDTGIPATLAELPAPGNEST